MTVTVALPVLNGMPLLDEVLAAAAAQRVDRDLELLVCDSGSSDGSAEAARRHGARLLRIPPGAFGHGRTRNLLVEAARGEHVAFLTQDATPADDRWLQRLLAAVERDDRVGLATGPYLPRRGTSVSVVRELEAFFATVPPLVRGQQPFGPASFATDANALVVRAAWHEVRFRDVAYAEDQLLARDLLAAGWAKAFVAAAPVVHSHAYTTTQQLQRWFDEFRALREVHGHRADVHPRRVAGQVRRSVAADIGFARARELRVSVPGSLGYHAGRALVAAVATRAGALPAPLRRRLSLEGRHSFEPLD